MAQLTITLDRGDEGGLLVRVALRPDPESLPCEHEELHRRLVSALLPAARTWQRERPAREAKVG